MSVKPTYLLSDDSPEQFGSDTLSLVKGGELPAEDLQVTSDQRNQAYYCCNKEGNKE